MEKLAEKSKDNQILLYHGEEDAYNQILNYKIKYLIVPLGKLEKSESLFDSLTWV